VAGPAAALTSSTRPSGMSCCRTWPGWMT